MIIQDHNVQLDSQRFLAEHHEKKEQLSVWQGENRVDIENGERTVNLEAMRGMSDSLSLSQEGINKYMSSFKDSLSCNCGSARALESDEDEYMSPELKMMKILLEEFFGIKVDIIKPEQHGESGKVHQSVEVPQEGQASNAPDAAEPEPQGWGISYSYHESTYREERVEFSAGGRVTTGDGREINFDAQLEMSKETYEEVNVEFRAGDALIDPLALNFDGRGVQLTAEKYEFDLDSDGEKENISFVEKGSGFLVIDKNQNGTIDNGNEMLGPSTNNGFLELKAYDGDENNWIDENDSIFYRLNVWTKNEDGSDKLSSLKESGVGAIYLGNSRTDFDLGEGKLRDTGVYLSEDGTVGFAQEVDLMVS
ncbi:MAG: hypothetical protein GY757_13565 [bacterium]|nr:hypothetical protein [bacterium]